jgi:hypothetical protein
MITLGVDAALVDPATMALLPLEPNNFSVFFHEYIHYLQNITTPAGYHSFRRALDLWSLFRETVDQSGVSQGSASLSQERSAWVSQLLEISEAFDGWVDSNLPDSFDVDSFTVDSVSSHPSELTLGAQTSRVTEVIVKGSARDPNGSADTYSYRFGTIAIMEGLAFELDQIMASGELGTNKPKHAAPAFPYHVLRKLIASQIPAADSLSIIRLGCLSLMSNDPAGALFDLSRFANENLATGLTLHESIDRIGAGQIVSLIEAVIAVDIPDHRSRFAKGTIGKAIAHVHELFETHLRARVQNLFLESLALTPEGRVDLGGVSTLLGSIPPCAVLQERSGSKHEPDRDLLWVSGDRQYSLRDELAVLHCALHFMLIHLDFDSILATRDVDKSHCPFYTCCSLPLRTANPKTCRQEPWKAFSWTGWTTSERCWYAAGVASSIGG